MAIARPRPLAAALVLIALSLSVHAACNVRVFISNSDLQGYYDNTEFGDGLQGTREREKSVNANSYDKHSNTKVYKLFSSRSRAAFLGEQVLRMLYAMCFFSFSPCELGFLVERMERSAYSPLGTHSN